MAICNTNSLMASGKMFQMLGGGLSQVARLAMLKQYLLSLNPSVDTSVNALLAIGKCFTCLTPVQQRIVKLQLLCEILGANFENPDGGCVLPEQPTGVHFENGAGAFSAGWSVAVDPELDYLIEWGTVSGGPYPNSQSVAPNLRSVGLSFGSPGNYFGIVTARNAVDCTTLGTPENDPFTVGPTP
jgi:hypothetical protein